MDDHIEIERAMRGAANRKLNEGLEQRDSLREGMRFEKPKGAPRILIALFALAALALIGLIVSYLASVPPAHIMIVGLIVGFILILGRRSRRK
jgi:Flp pilus assembly protein TadB